MHWKMYLDINRGHLVVSALPQVAVLPRMTIHSTKIEGSRQLRSEQRHKGWETMTTRQKQEDVSAFDPADYSSSEVDAATS
jgi:hypothetical protein